MLRTHAQYSYIVFPGAWLIKMSASVAEGGGYDYQFLDSSLARDYECMICHYVAKDPRQAQCCGATFCRSCILRSRCTLTECPNCRAPSFILIQDKAQRQRINKLRIKCPHCEWTGAIADIQTHINLEHSDLASAEEPIGETAETTAHAYARDQLDWSFSEFRKPSSDQAADADEDDEAGDESQPLMELKQLQAADHESLNDTQESSDEIPYRKSVLCFSSNCMDGTKTIKV